MVITCTADKAIASSLGVRWCIMWNWCNSCSIQVDDEVMALKNLMRDKHTHVADPNSSDRRSRYQRIYRLSLDLVDTILRWIWFKKLISLTPERIFTRFLKTKLYCWSQRESPKLFNKLDENIQILETIGKSTKKPMLLFPNAIGTVKHLYMFNKPKKNRLGRNPYTKFTNIFLLMV